MYSYKIPYPNGETRGVNVEPFKDTTEAYVRERITEKPLAPRSHGFHKRYDFFWDYHDIRELLDKVIEDYEEWINSVE